MPGTRCQGWGHLSCPEGLEERETEAQSEPGSAGTWGDPADTSIPPSSCYGLEEAANNKEQLAGNHSIPYNEDQLATNLPRPLNRVCALPIPPLVRAGSRALCSRGREGSSPWQPPVASLTPADDVELLVLMLSQVAPGHPCEHRACRGPSGTAVPHGSRRR